MNYIKFISKDRGKYCGYNCIFYVANCARNILKVFETKGFVRIIISVMSPLKNTSSNSLFQIKKIRIKNATKFIIGNLNII